VNAATHAIIEIATRMICPSSHSSLNYLRLALRFAIQPVT
jgi:hypothetical protein